MLDIFKKETNLTAVIGVAGSKGKTTITHILSHIFEIAGARVGYLSSNGLYVAGDFQNNPNANHISKKELQSIFKRARKELDFLIVEFTSRNLINKVYDGLQIDGGILTNITDDFTPGTYRSFDEYSATKIDFINLIANEGYVVLNNTDTNSVNVINRLGDSIRKTIYSTWVDHEKVFNPKFFIDGMSFYLEGLGEIKAPISAQFNLLNVVKAVTVAQKYVPNDIILHALDTIPGIQGRFNFYRKSPDFIIVDKVNTIDSLDKSLSYIRKTKPQSSKVITVIGADDIDHPFTNSGKTVAENSDIVIMTSQDSGSGKVFDINNIIHRSAEDYRGILVERFNATDEYSMADKEKLQNRINMVSAAGDVPFIAFDEESYTGRLDAIKLAILLAQPGDVVYVTGKGADSSIKYHNVDYEWSDYEAIRLALQEKSGKVS